MKLRLAFFAGLIALSGCSTTPPSRDDVGRIPDRLVSGIVAIKSAETDFIEQKQGLLNAVVSRQSNQIPSVEKAAAKTIEALNVLQKDPNWVTAQRELLGRTVVSYEAYFKDYGRLARLWIIEQPGRPEDSGMAEQEKRLLDQEHEIRSDLKKLADMMAWELTRKIDTVNALILTNP